MFQLAVNNTKLYNTKFVKRHVAVASEAVQSLLTTPRLGY